MKSGLSRLWILFLAGLLSTVAAAQPPLDEIRQLLRAGLMPAPEMAQLAELSEQNLADQLLQLDPYARYFEPEQGYLTLPETVERAGIGAEILMQQDEILLLPYQGAVAERAGVPYRSRLLAVDQQPVASDSLQQLASRLRGPEGSWVSLLVETTKGERVEFRFLREIYRPLHVELLQGEQRIIRIRDFITSMTVPSLRATVEFITQSPQADHVPPIIIDLRDSTGGELFEALDLAAAFLPAGTELVTLVDREGEVQRFHAPQGSKYAHPLFILIGPYTASAAEIFAGILQTQGRAVVMGELSFGKCSSQTQVRLSNQAMLRYTNREVLLPGGIACTGAGITPDVSVSDSQLNDAGYLVDLINEWTQQ